MIDQNGNKVSDNDSINYFSSVLGIYEEGKRLREEEEKRKKEMRKIHRILIDFEPYEFVALGEMMAIPKVASLIKEYGVADFGEGPAIGRNMNSGLLYVALECSSFCFIINPEYKEEVRLMFSCPYDGTEVTTSKELGVHFSNLKREGHASEIDKDAVKVFQEWEA